jgi:hypothetical protein
MMKIKTMVYAALGAVTFKAGKVLAKKKAAEAAEGVTSGREPAETTRHA